MQGGGIAVSLLFMVVVPTVIAVVINEASKGKIPFYICPYFDPFAKICLLLVIATNASIVAPAVKFSDILIWKTAALVIALSFAGFLLVKLISVIGRCRAPKDTAMIICGGLRNNSAIMTIAVTFFPEAAVIPSLVSIVFQQTIAAIMGKLFVKKNEERNVTLL